MVAVSRSVGQLDSKSDTHVYTRWTAKEGRIHIVHSEVVIRHEHALHVSLVGDLPSEFGLLRPRTYEEWTGEMEMSSEGNPVNCQYCLEWIHA